MVVVPLSVALAAESIKVSISREKKSLNLKSKCPVTLAQVDKMVMVSLPDHSITCPTKGVNRENLDAHFRDDKRQNTFADRWEQSDCHRPSSAIVNHRKENGKCGAE